MTIYDSERAVAEAIADARGWALASQDTAVTDPDADARAEIEGLARLAPSLPTAASLLSYGLAVVAINRDTLEPASSPMGTLGELVAHWRSGYADGVAVVAGTHPGRTIFALTGPTAKVREWLAEHGREQRDRYNGNGTVVGSEPSWLPCPPYVTLTWTPPPAASARTVVTYGAGVLDVPLSLRSDRRDMHESAAVTSFVAWSATAVWTVPPSSDAGGPVHGEGLRQLRVPSKKLGGGVAVVGEGSVVPWAVHRPDGWTLTASGPPRDADEGMPEWLVDSIGASWKAVR